LGSRIKFPLYISQDGSNPEVQDLAMLYAEQRIASYINHKEDKPPVPKSRRGV
jgi:hypothetical protein